MDGSSTGLPNEWISRLFGRFRSIYGNKVDVMYGSTATDPKETERQMADLTATWASVLGRYEGEDLRRALETMLLAYADFPPTLPQFSAMCRDARSARGQAANKVTNVRYGQVAPEVLAVIHELTADPMNRRRDAKDWARKLVKDDADGKTVNLYALQSAREALKL